MQGWQKPPGTGWLTNQGFINAEHVIFCKDKLVCLAQLAQGGDRVILIDDLYQKVMTRFSHLAETDPVRRWGLEHFILVAFGAKEAFHECPLKVFPLPKWSDVDSLVAKLERSQ